MITKILCDGEYKMGREEISENVKRMLYAESMGRCMNPNCLKELFRTNGDIIEKAHIDPYCKTADNSFENLVVLCPNCHTDFDKNEVFSPEEVLNWKETRKQELDKFFCKKFGSFDELKKEVFPLLFENKSIYENYYLGDNKELWEKFEPKIIINNRKLKLLFENNRNLFQNHNTESYSNLACVDKFMLHVDEFEKTRLDDEKNRQVLFPKEINSMFGIDPVIWNMLPSTESLENLITKLNHQGKFEAIFIGCEQPFIVVNDEGKFDIIFLEDTPRLRQMYFDYDCFKRAGVRLKSLNFALMYINHKGIKFEFINYNNLREIMLNGIKMIFIYKYCLSEVELLQLLPEENSVVVNLHNWNGACCISEKAYILAKKMNVTLLGMDNFYEYINELKHK